MVQIGMVSEGDPETVQTKQREILTLLRNPTTGNSLILEDDVMIDPITEERFEIRNGIPVILRKDDVFGNNRKQQIGYDWFSYAYDLMYALPLSRLQQWLDELAEIITIESGDRVLETAVGTGQQFRNLARHGMDGHFFGNDISYGMLNKCQKNLRKWDIDVGLVQGNAEALPFQSERFDVVFHVGGFNFFNDKQAAIDEMIRVAKPDAKLYIADETSEFINLPQIVVRLIPERATRVADPPIDLVPDNMHDISSMKIANGKFWLVSFRKSSI
ncbi:methyltransferase domain-containing protein [Natrarchaeobius oligotrophus]|uniref:Methyltransferase domain-containing protein n=2 Tax=Natrarchaeobius TaxID=2501796 RepID=A0A3N6PGT4_NATCH|nr:methyltransferase domain-containing protein [Natrarchaeobius chitinivorans]